MVQFLNIYISQESVACRPCPVFASRSKGLQVMFSGVHSQARKSGDGHSPGLFSPGHLPQHCHADESIYFMAFVDRQQWNVIATWSACSGTRRKRSINSQRRKVFS